MSNAIPYRRTVARFISSSDNAEYGVTLAGTSEERRVIVERNGTIRPPKYDTTPETRLAMADAVADLLLAERERAVVWCTQHDALEFLESARVYTFDLA